MRDPRRTACAVPAWAPLCRWCRLCCFCVVAAAKVAEGGSEKNDGRAGVVHRVARGGTARVGVLGSAWDHCGHGWLPWAARWSRPHSARTSHACRVRAWGLGGVECGTPARGTCSGAVIASRGSPSLGVRSLRAWVAATDSADDPPPPGLHVGSVLRVGVLQGLWYATRVGTVEHRTHADRAHARQSRGRRCTWSHAPPSHVQHARRARGGHLRRRGGVRQRRGGYPTNISNKSIGCASRVSYT